MSLNRQNIGCQRNNELFKSINNDEFDQLLEQAVDIIPCFGKNYFRRLAPPARWQNMAQCFSNVGKFSNHIDDPYFPGDQMDMARNALAIVRCRSPVETEEIPRLCQPVQPASL